VVTHDVTPSSITYYKNGRIKQCHRENRALRIKTTTNNTYDFGIGKGLHNLLYTRVYNRLLRPGLAAALPALRRAFEVLAVEIDAVINDAKLVTQNLTHLSKVSLVKQG
jgi:hypothetical protein